VRSQIRTIISDPHVSLSEPIVFEVLRHASEHEAARMRRVFAELPVLSTPLNLWSLAIELGQRCRRAGIVAGPLDLLIATVAIHHEAELVTFDWGFQRIASVSALRVNVIERPTAE